MRVRSVEPCPFTPFDVVIVLGAKARPDGTPSAAMERRVKAACAVVTDGLARHVLFSGGPVAHPRPEAWIMRDLAVLWGMSADLMVIEARSRNTIENARFSIPLVRERAWRRVAVVTDGFHVPRALYVFRRFGLKAEGIPAYPSGRGGRRWWLAHFREAAAMPWTILRVERQLLFERFR